MLPSEDRTSTELLIVMYTLSLCSIIQHNHTSNG